MAKFIFTGDPKQGTNRKVRREGPDDSRSIVAFGIEFPRGEEVDVPEDHPAIGKLRGNSHFEEIVASQGAGSGDPEREALVARAKELGLKPGNKGVEKLKEEIAEAEKSQGAGSGE